MVRLFIFIFLFISAAEASTEACTTNLAAEINYNPERAEKLCIRAEKLKVNVAEFEGCLSRIYTHTKIPPEIIAPYCMKRQDENFRECVIHTYNSDSNDNAFKSCMKKRSEASVSESIATAPKAAPLRAPRLTSLSVQ